MSIASRHRELCVTHDGIVRNPQIDREQVRGGPWDGRRYSYIPECPLQIDPRLELHQEFDTDLDPITYQVLRSRFWHKNLEHADVIRRLAGSVAVVHHYDFAVSLHTETGDTLAISPSLQYFTGLSDLIVQYALERRSGGEGITNGDIFVQNDPYVGAAHQSDVSLFAPIFWEDKLFCWAYNVTHTGDLGGVDPGGWAVNARDIYDEGVTIPPTKIGRNFELDMSLVEMIARQGRDPAMVTINTRSQAAGLEIMRRALVEMLERYGPAVVKGVMRRMIAECSKVVSSRLLQIPDGTWRERLYVSGPGGDGKVAHPESITLTKHRDRVVCTNEGTAPQSGWGNATYGILRSNVVSALSMVLAYDQLGCIAGVANHVAFDPVPGTRNVATHPAACSALTSSMVGANVAGLVASKMAMSGTDELRRRANASGGLSAPMGDLAFGLDEEGRFLSVDAGANGSGQAIGAIGAFPVRDGIDSGASWWLMGTSAGNVEDGENDGVVLLLYRREATDSGGPGRWRGGMGGMSAYVPSKVFSTVVQIMSIEPSVNNAAGLGGGHFGLAGNYLVTTGGKVGEVLAAGKLPRDRAELEAMADCELQRLDGRGLIAPLGKSDCMIVDYNGGGGFGDALERELELVQTDVAAGRVSVRAAYEHYGVVILSDGLVDRVRSEERRSSVRRERLAAARFDGERRGPLAEAETVVAGAAGSVDLVRGPDALAWACGGCRESLGPSSENFKLAAAVRRHHPPDVDERMYPDPGRFGDARIELRQYLCPSCGTMLAQEYCHRDDEPLFDFCIHEVPERAR